MLVDVTIVNSPINQMIAAINGNDQATTRLQEGIYHCGGFNFEHETVELQNLDFDFSYPKIPPKTDEHINCYGVCDNVQQILDKTMIAEDPGRSYVVSVTIVKKENQSPEGGWRWHKWGPYIGDLEPTTEYLYDEPEIDQVYVYHIYEVPMESEQEPSPLHEQDIALLEFKKRLEEKE